MGENKQTMIEMRDAYSQALLELGEAYPRMIYLDADLHTSTKATVFKKRWSDRFIQCGIAEQNMFGTAAGLAFEGFIPLPRLLRFLHREGHWIKLPYPFAFPVSTSRSPDLMWEFQQVGQGDRIIVLKILLLCGFCPICM